MSNLFTANDVLWAGIEVAEGVDPGLTAANCIRVLDLDVQTPNDTNAKEISRGFFGAFPQQITNLRTEVNFSVCMAASGVAGTPPDYGVFLRMVGFEETLNAGTSVEYCPRSAGFETGTLYPHKDRNLHQSNGVRGNWTLTLPSGDFPLWGFNMIGSYNGPVDILTQAACTTANIVDPVIGSSTNVPRMRIGDGAGGFIDLCVSELTLDGGNDINRRQLYNCEGTSLSGRAITGSVTYDAFAVGDFDPYALWQDGTEVPLEFTHGIIPGNIVAGDAPAMQILNISYGDDNGCTQHTLDFQLNPVAGNDELCFLLS